MPSQVSLDDEVVESVMLDLMAPQVAIIKTFRVSEQSVYMEQLRTYVHSALVRAFDPERRLR